MKAIWLKEDAKSVIKKQQNDGGSVVREANKQGIQAIQKGTGRVVNDIFCPHSKLNLLTPNIKLAQTRIRISNADVGFARHVAPLSNMHKTPYIKDGQWSMDRGTKRYLKVAQEIIDTNCPYPTHNIAKGIHTQGWDAVSLPTLKEHMKEKYSHNEHCMHKLLNTGTKKLLELTWDRKWGVG